MVFGSPMIESAQVTSSLRRSKCDSRAKSQNRFARELCGTTFGSGFCGRQQITRLPVRASDHHDDLADLLVRLEVSVGFNDLLEWERLGDDRPQATVGEPVVDEFLAAFQPCWIARDFHHHVAADRGPPGENVE